MSNSTCLAGPAFSLTGSLYYTGADVTFQVVFDQDTDAANILVYQWYLDNLLIIGQSESTFTGQLACGQHSVGIRLLSDEGWSGVKSLIFYTCWAPVSTLISGPDSVDEGASASYFIMATYPDGSQQDETAAYIFSCPEGSFSANVFTASTNNTEDDTRQTTITATKTGAAPLTKAITIRDTSIPVVTSIWVEDSTQSYCETKIVEQGSISNFASPTNAAIAADHTLLYTDPTLNGVIYFNPAVITDGSQATLISLGLGTRPTGAYYHAPSDKLYVNAFNGGGLKVIDCASKALTKTIPYGTDGPYSRGNVYYIAALNEIWAIGNSGFLRISAADETVVPSTAFSAQGSVYITSVNNKIYVFYDANDNEVKVYDNSLNLTATISGLCVNTFVNGAHVSRGYYTDIVNQKIYVGENSSSGGITVIDAVTDTISKRVTLDKEGKAYASPGIISFHPLRNTVYIGGSLLDTEDSPLARLWAFDTLTETITQTITLSANTVVNSLIYYPPNNSVYAASAGQIPESDPNTSQFTDGVIFKFN
ncbi:MAG: hypothetical protein JWR38_5258 [Mucilaginibacter sp.]|nr:hypothetical protein [Mucilaginibacter sp.]